MSFWATSSPNPDLVPDPGAVSELEAEVPENSPHREFDVDDRLLNGFSRGQQSAVPGTTQICGAPAGTNPFATIEQFAGHRACRY